MPRSRNSKKGVTTRQHRKNRNIRVAEQRYINSPKRWIEKFQKAQEDNTDGVSEEISN
jgi:hypothetical protein